MRTALPTLAALAMLSTGCAARSHVVETATAAPARVHIQVVPVDATGATIAKAARHFLTNPRGGFRDDCSGFVEAVLHRAGITHVVGSTRQMWSISLADGAVHRTSDARVGDLAFFDNTYDRNGNGEADDALTHVAVVIAVEADGTVVMAHDSSSRGPTTLRMNLHHRDEAGAGTQRLNDNLRWPDPKRPTLRVLTGQLWRGFATVRADAVAAVE